jgi:predicted nucleic acid-binding protein
MSSSPALERGLDTMLLVYSLLPGHPAAVPCSQFIAAQSGWFTSPLVVVEAKNILTKVYGVDPGAATAKLQQFAATPVVQLGFDERAAAAAFALADTHGLDITDAVLLQLTQQHGAAFLATDDYRLTQACRQLGIAPVSPLDAALRQQVAVWEAVNLASKGLARILQRIHEWLSQGHPQAAHDFWSMSGGGSHLP